MLRYVSVDGECGNGMPLEQPSERERGKHSMFTDRIVADGKIAPTNIASSMVAQYIGRMSVPPVMMAQVAYEVYEQCLE